MKLGEFFNNFFRNYSFGKFKNILKNDREILKLCHRKHKDGLNLTRMRSLLTIESKVSLKSI